MEYKNREDYEINKVYLWKDNCPFCLYDLSETNEILYKTEYWIIMYNNNPYFDIKRTLIAFPKRHSEFTTELTKEEFWDLIEVNKFMKTFFEDQEYFSLLRESKSNKSVEHLHYHYIPWIIGQKVIDWENYFKVRYKV